MGQKVSPISLREFINKITDSRWIAGKKDYAALLAEDVKIRKFIEKKLKKAGLAKVVIERFAKKVVVTIHTSRPGMIIGKNGADIETLRNDIKKLVKNDQVVVNIYEVRRPDLNAQLVAQNIAQQIEGRVSFKRAMKKAVQNAQKAGAQGIKVMCSGRLNGAEIARSEQIREGRIPLHTLRADIDYSLVEAHTTYGRIGIKVWICKGEIYGKPELVPTSIASANKKQSAPKQNGGAPRRNKRNSSNK